MVAGLVRIKVALGEEKVALGEEKVRLYIVLSISLFFSAICLKIFLKVCVLECALLHFITVATAQPIFHDP